MIILQALVELHMAEPVILAAHIDEPKCSPVRRILFSTVQAEGDMISARH